MSAQLIVILIFSFLHSIAYRHMQGGEKEKEKKNLGLCGKMPTM